MLTKFQSLLRYVVNTAPFMYWYIGMWKMELYLSTAKQYSIIHIMYRTLRIIRPSPSLNKSYCGGYLHIVSAHPLYCPCELNL